MDFHGLSSIFPLLIPIVGMLIPIIAIVMGVSAKMQREKLRHETMRAFAERGLPVPAELLDEHGHRGPPWARHSRRGSPARHAAVNIGAGLGLMLMFYLMNPNSWMWSIGAIPLFVGVSLLIAGWAERGQGPSVPPQA